MEMAQSIGPAAGNGAPSHRETGEYIPRCLTCRRIIAPDADDTLPVTVGTVKPRIRYIHEGYCAEGLADALDGTSLSAVIKIHFEPEATGAL